MKDSTANADQWKAAIRAAMEKQKEMLKADPTRSIADPTLPVAVVAAHMDLEQERIRFEAGDNNALLGAIRICANHDIVLPEWTSRAFIRAYDDVLNFKKGSWDEAFGHPIPKGKHLSALRKKRTKKWAVWNAVQDAIKTKNQAIDEQLFAEIGKDLGLGKTLAAEFYYSCKAFMDRGMPLAVEELLKPWKVPQKGKRLRNYTDD